MDYWINRFESELNLKLSQKSSSYVSNETILLKSFKYFDLDNSGAVDFEEWKKALQKIGVVLPPPPTSYEIFQFYDADNSGSLDYKEFCTQIIGHRSRLNKPLSIPLVQSAEHLLQSLRSFLSSQTKLNLFSLAQNFLTLSPEDPNISYSLFSKSLFDLKFPIDPSQSTFLFKYFDKLKQGKINYFQVLSEIRGEVSHNRISQIKSTFSTLSPKNLPIPLNSLRKRFLPGTHPDVTTGKSSEQSILLTFLKGFEINHQLYGIKNSETVALPEFIEYYSNISFTIESDHYFERILKNTWKINSASKKNLQTWTKKKFNPRLGNGIPKGFESVFVKFRKELAKRGAKGVVGVMKEFRLMDEDGSGSLSLAEFRKGCLQFGICLGEHEIVRLFNGIDRDRNGVVDYEEFLKVARGFMNAFRRDIVTMAWNGLDKDESKLADLKQLNLVFDARGHPDVKNGKRSVAEIINEFLETFETHHKLSVFNQFDQKVTFEEFLEYYEGISITIEDDQIFEKMIKSAWKVSEPCNKITESDEIPYAGQKKAQTMTGPPFAVSPEKTEYLTASNKFLSTVFKKGFLNTYGSLFIKSRKGFTN